MSQFSRHQVLNFILTNIIDNNQSLITEPVLRQVLNYMVDRIYQPAEIPVDKSAAGYSSSNLNLLLDEMISAIAQASASMSATSIRDALQSLINVNRLNKSAIHGAETALNRRGKGNVFSGEWQDLHMEHISRGDFWIFQGTPNASLSNGDWVVALVNNPVGWNFSDGINWESISFTAGDVPPSAVQLADLLNSIVTIAEMISANRIRFDTNSTVFQAINGLQLSLSLKQNALSTFRTLFDQETSTSFTVSGTVMSIIVFSVNRIPYQGIAASSFSGGAGAFDFRYTSNGSDTLIVLNPSLGISFSPNDLIDIIYA